MPRGLEVGMASFETCLNGRDLLLKVIDESSLSHGKPNY